MSLLTTTSLPDSIKEDISSDPQSTTYMIILMQSIVPVLFSIIVVVGFFGNLLVIVVIVANTQMRNTTNILIISLALADLVFIVFCVPFTAVTYSTGGWPLGTVFCKIYMFTIYTTAYCSVYTLALMSFDRYLAVVHPIDSMTWRTQRNTVISVFITWFTFMTLNLPLLISSDVVTSRNSSMNTTTHYCMFKTLLSINETTGDVMGDNKEAGQLYFGVFFCFGYLLPLTAICVLYGFMLERLLFGRTAKMSQSSETMRSKRRVTRMIVVVIVLFALCWLPIQSVFMLQYFGPDWNTPLFRTIHVISNCLAYTNSMINPILYAFLSENFRRAFLKFLCLQIGRQNDPVDFDRTQFPNSKSTAAGKLKSSSRKQQNENHTSFKNGLTRSDQENQAHERLPMILMNNNPTSEPLEEIQEKVNTPIYIETQIDC